MIGYSPELPARGFADTPGCRLSLDDGFAAATQALKAMADLPVSRLSGVAILIDTSLRGIRCKAAQEIIDLAGTIGAATEGTIVYELDGEGGQLVNVQWDDGTTSLVSSEEIVITDGDIVWQ